MYTQFKNSNDEPSTAAMIEQFAMMCSIFWNRRADAEAIIAEMGGGQILRWSHSETRLPPSYVVWRQGMNYFVNVGGTFLPSQWAGDFAGYLGRPQASGSAIVQSFFNHSWQAIKDDIKRAIGPMNDQKFTHWSGHSLGSAVSFLGALEAVRSWGRNHVRYMGFGGPRSVTAGMIQPLPDPCYQIINGGDWIPFLPENQLSWFINLPLMRFMSVASDWQNYGAYLELNPDGTFTRDLGRNFTGNSIWSDIGDTIDRHPPASYVQTLATRFAGGHQ